MKYIIQIAIELHGAVSWYSLLIYHDNDKGERFFETYQEARDYLDTSNYKNSNGVRILRIEYSR